jgi:hypothetical protein
MTVRKKITTSEFISEVVEKTKEPEAKMEPETLPVSEQPEPKPEVIPEPEPPVAFFPPENPAPVIKNEVIRRNQPRFSARSNNL